MQGLDLFGPLEVFSEANQTVTPSKNLYETLVVSASGQAVRTASGVSIGVDASIKRCPPLHTLIVPGGSGARHANFSAATLRWLAKRSQTTPRVGSICTGLFLLARTGALDGMVVTTHWHHVQEAQTRFPRLTVDADALFTRRDRFFTSAGVSAGIDMALALLEEDFGSNLALDVARHLVVYFKRPGDQRQYSQLLRRQKEIGGEFSSLIAWMRDNLKGDLTSSALAVRVGLGERQFRRNFVRAFGETPVQHVERLRIEAASDWLVSDGLSIAEIAHEAGYKSPDAFRRAFEKLRGIAPSKYRRRFFKEHQS